MALRSRDDVLGFLFLHQCQQAFESAQALDSVLAQIATLQTDNPWLEKRRAKLLFQVGQSCERSAELALAEQIYRACAYPGARARLIRVLERQEDYAQAMALACAAHEAPESPAEQQHLLRVLPRLRRKLGAPAVPKAKPRDVTRLDLALPPPPPSMAVEYCVQAHLSEPDAPVYYVENGLINSLFGLLCWEAIFAPLPGAFFHPFQRGPADLHSEDFHQRRASLFAACLSELQDDRYKQTIRQRYVDKWGIQSPFVFWSLLSEDLLEQALACLPAEHLRCWFERLLLDIQGQPRGYAGPDPVLARAANLPHDRSQRPRRSPARQPTALAGVLWRVPDAGHRLLCALGAVRLSYTVAVRALCEFTAKVGDLDLRFTPSPSAQEGIAGHRTVASRRSAHYQNEVALEGEYEELKVRGRADGYDPDSNRLEEVKTYRGDLDAQPANHRQLHWAQVKVYGWLMCQKLGLAHIDLALVYFDIVGEGETSLNQRFAAADLQCFFNRQCALFLGWARQEMQHRDARNRAAQALAFPHSAFRPGQRNLAESVYKAVSTGRCLMAQAPTGIGKTVGTIFPMLKALAPQQLDKVLFLTAKTPGRKLALDAAQVLYRQQSRTAAARAGTGGAGQGLRTPGQGLPRRILPAGQGFLRPLARRAYRGRQGAACSTRHNLREVALEHGVCPYYLSQEMARWSRPGGRRLQLLFRLWRLLFGLAQLNQWRVAVLVDEAHNLVERARSMYSASLDQYTLKTVRDTAPEPLKKPLQRLNREWNALHKDQLAPYQAYAARPGQTAPGPEPLRQRHGRLLQRPPRKHSMAICRAFYFEALQFAKVAELFNEHFIFDISKRRLARQAQQFHLVPAQCGARRIHPPTH